MKLFLLKNLLTFLLLTMVLLCFLISTLLIVITFLTSKKTFPDLEKSSPFECGFSPKFLFRTPFSIQFFLTALLFLIFDVELILLFPFLIKNYSYINYFHFLFCFLFFILLFLGLYHEWNQKSLQWN